MKKLPPPYAFAVIAGLAGLAIGVPSGAVLAQIPERSAEGTARALSHPEGKERPEPLPPTVTPIPAPVETVYVEIPVPGPIEYVEVPGPERIVEKVVEVVKEVPVEVIREVEVPVPGPVSHELLICGPVQPVIERRESMDMGWIAYCGEN